MTVGIASANLYTVPAGRTAIVRTITLYNRGGGTARVLLTLNGSTGAEAVWGPTLLTQTTEHFNGSLVMDPGDELRAICTVATSIAVAGFGSLLLGEPE